jgi:hypothetical protein
LRVFLSITELILLGLHTFGDLLLLRKGTIGTCGTRWRSDTQRILAIRKTDPSMLDETIQSVAVQLVQRLGRIVNIRKLSIFISYQYDLKMKRVHIPQQSTSAHCSSAGSIAFGIQAVD